MMDTKGLTREIGRLIAVLASAESDERRALITDFYKGLQAAGLSEPAAAALQHAISLAAELPGKE